MKIVQRKGARQPWMAMWPGELKVSFGMKLFIIALAVLGLSFISTMWATGVAMAGIGIGLAKEDEDAIKGMLDGVAEKHKAFVKQEIDAAIKGLQTADQVAAKMEALGLKDGVIAAVEKAIKDQGDELRKMIENKNRNEEPKSLKQILLEQKDKIAKVVSENGRFSFSIPTDVHKTTVIRTAVSGSTQAYRLPDIGQLPFLSTVMSGLFRHVQLGPDTNGVVRYVDQNSATRNAAERAENTQAPESAIDWIERTMTIEKIMDSIPVSKEMLKDVGFVEGELRRLLENNLALKEDDFYYDGSGVSPISKGVFTYASAFNSAPYVNKTSNANIYDLAAVLRVDIMTNKGKKYLPNVLLMNPVDVLLYKLKKGNDGQYILPPFIDASGKVIDGMTVVESNQVAANQLVAGDFRYGTIFDLEDTLIEVGFIDKQFVFDTMTLKATKRTALLVRNVDADAFRKVTNIQTALDDIGPVA